MDKTQKQNYRMREVLTQLVIGGKIMDDDILSELEELGIITKPNDEFYDEVRKSLELQHQHEQELNQRLIAILNAHPEIRTFPEVQRPVKPSTNSYGFFFENKENQYEFERFQRHADEFEGMMVNLNERLQHFVGEQVTPEIVNHMATICNDVLDEFTVLTGAQPYLADGNGVARQVKRFAVGNDVNTVSVSPVFRETNLILIDEDWIVRHE